MSSNLTQNERPDSHKTVAQVPDKLGVIANTSFSALKEFELCAFKSFLKRVKKYREPDSPAANRGSDIHEKAEHFVCGTLGELHNSCEKFKSEFIQLRDIFSNGQCEVEQEWGFTTEWEPVSWADPRCWFRLKIDAFVTEDDTSCRVIDYKTGKRFNNEISHAQQTLLYAISAFMRYPELEYAQTELWYLDIGDNVKRGYSRSQALEFLPSFYNRMITMTTATEFPPNPSKHNCRFCDFKSQRTDDDRVVCEWGVE